MHILENSEDPDEMLHNAAFHQGLHYLLRQKLSSEKESNFYLKIITFDPSLYNYKQWNIPSSLYQAEGRIHSYIKG